MFAGLLIIGIIFAILGMVVSGRMKSRFKEYSQIPVSGGLTGKEIAEKMLRDNDIRDVQVISVEGHLTDHYNPQNKTVNLSADVYNSNSIAAAAVAAHECGHAVQHANAYSYLQLRSALVPIQNISGQILNFIMLASIFGGYFLLNMFSTDTMMLIIIGCYTVITMFSIVTLPVEFDASKRALAWIDNSRIVNSEQHDKAANALKWAASTYVVAALGSLAALLFLILSFLHRD